MERDAAIDARQAPVEAALWLARAFADGRRLVVAAPGREDHAHHVAVEFVHPVVTGTKALPTAAVRDLTVAGDDAVRMLIGEGGTVDGVDIVIPVDGSDVDVVRGYHLLWELVHVALEHPGLVGAEGAEGGDSTGFLYPFLDASETDEVALATSLRSSAEAKMAESAAVVARARADNANALDAASSTVADMVRDGGRVYVMGNGGSAADAARLARVLAALDIPAAALVDDYAVLTALANDIGVEAVFARQVEALVSAGDVVIGLSTSGSSANLLAGFAAADGIGAATVGFSGYDGGEFASSPAVHHCLVVDAMSVHRIQEAQAALADDLCAGLAGRLDRAVPVGTAPAAGGGA